MKLTNLQLQDIDRALENPAINRLQLITLAKNLRRHIRVLDAESVRKVGSVPVVTVEFIREDKSCS